MMKGLIKMIGCFIGGMFVGGFLGVVTMCILSVAGKTDCDFDDTIIQHDKSDAKEKAESKDDNLD